MNVCGIDWANDHHDALCIDEQGRQLGSIRVAHSPEGLTRLDSYLERIAAEEGHEQVACIIETTHGLLITHLLEQGWPVYPVNPRTVARHRAPSGVTTDTIDAYLLAMTGRADFADLHRLQPDGKLIQELKELTRDQDRLIKTQTRLLNQLTACLKAYYPAGLIAFSKLEQPSTLAFWRAYPTPQQARSATTAELTTLLRQVRYPGAQRKAQELLEVLRQPQLAANAVTTRTKSRLLLDQLEPLMRQIADYDQEIERLFFQHEDHELFPSLPGAGPRLAPRMLAEVGEDRDRSAAASALQALAGTSPVLYQSGTYAKAHRRLGCIKPLRNTLQQFAFQSLRHGGWAKAYYLRKRAEGKSHTVAVRARANGWVRILFAIWMKKEGLSSCNIRSCSTRSCFAHRIARALAGLHAEHSPCRAVPFEWDSPSGLLAYALLAPLLLL
jgi:transposase